MGGRGPYLTLGLLLLEDNDLLGLLLVARVTAATALLALVLAGLGTDGGRALRVTGVAALLLALLALLDYDDDGLLLKRAS